MRTRRAVFCFDEPLRIQFFQLLDHVFLMYCATKLLILLCLRERMDLLLQIAIRRGNWVEGKPRVGANAG
jgi:hypothetical protein